MIDKALKELYARMDAAYEKAASAYGFVCDGCKDNCCLTHFHHHTLAEYLYLKEGLAGMAEGDRAEAENRAATVIKEVERKEAAGEKVRVLCPLNLDGLCVLYAHRPMICRMHGIPSEINPPGRPKIQLPGCDEMTARSGKAAEYAPFDRTPFFAAMAELERECKEAAGYPEKVKLTVAEMIVTELEI